MNDDLRGFYRLIQGSRERVFAWAETLPPEVYTRERPDFAYGSLRNIQAHVADCYLWWLGRHGFGVPQDRLDADLSALGDVSAVRGRFRTVDGMVSAP